MDQDGVKEVHMKLIVAVDKNWAIGKNNSLLVRIPNDLKNFRELTTGKVVVMGRKTLESFPGGMPLPKRVNIVMTTQKDYDGRGAIVVHNDEELWKTLSTYDSDDIFVIGGGSIYRKLLPYCDTAYVTRIDYAYEADTYMPNLDKEPGWHFVQRGEEQTFFDLIYYFDLYTNENPKVWNSEK
jgi:dihydrofolate reductase